MTFLVIVAFMPACSDQEPPAWLGAPATTGVSVAPAATGPPVFPAAGSAMFDGFVVPEGLRVLGAVFPSPWGTYREIAPESSWHAAFLVDGDPRVAVDDFLDQAVAQGLQVRSDCHVQLGGVGLHVERETIQGVDVIRMGIYESGGGNLSFEAVVGDGSSWAIIERCND